MGICIYKCNPSVALKSERKGSFFKMASWRTFVLRFISQLNEKWNDFNNVLNDQYMMFLVDIFELRGMDAVNLVCANTTGD